MSDQVNEAVAKADLRPLLDIGREAYSEVYVHVHGEDDNHYEALDAAIKAVLAAAHAHPSRGVVDDGMVERAAIAIHDCGRNRTSRGRWESYFPDYQDRVRDQARAALQAAALPADTVTVQEAWEWAGGNPGIKATRADLEAALRDLDAVCDEAAALPAVPETWRHASNPPTSKPHQWSEAVAAVTLSGDVFRVSYMHGDEPGSGTWQRLKAMADLGIDGTVVAWAPIPSAREVAMLAATPAHDQPAQGVEGES